MALSKNSGRQTILVAENTFSFDTLADDTGAVEAMFDIPANATIVGGVVIVDVAFDSTTSDALDVGDTDVDRYSATPVDLQALGATALDVTGYKYTVKDTIDVSWTAGVTSTATAGSGRVQIQYTIEDRATETQPVV